MFYHMQVGYLGCIEGACMVIISPDSHLAHIQAVTPKPVHGYTYGSPGPVPAGIAYKNVTSGPVQVIQTGDLLPAGYLQVPVTGRYLFTHR